ncbi:MAG: hypothetical protein ACYDHC_13410 [Desulfuromonadaceae bacterium]
MKCPKCGYNSFEYYDRCKKCSDDLTGYKQTYTITSLVLPLEAKEKLAAEYRSTESVTNQSVDITETHDDIFSFDLPEDSSSPSEQSKDDPFNFDEPATDLNKSARLMSDEDAFADLLESTSQNDGSISPAAGGPAVAKSTDASSAGPGEFDLESFSWDDTPSVSSTTDSKDIDEFDSLFGDTKDSNQK